eukprot:Pgem_evm1s15
MSNETSHHYIRENEPEHEEFLLQDLAQKLGEILPEKSEESPNPQQEQCPQQEQQQEEQKATVLQDLEQQEQQENVSVNSSSNGRPNATPGKRKSFAAPTVPKPYTPSRRSSALNSENVSVNSSSNSSPNATPRRRSFAAPTVPKPYTPSRRTSVLSYHQNTESPNISSVNLVSIPLSPNQDRSFQLPVIEDQETSEPLQYHQYQQQQYEQQQKQQQQHYLQPQSQPHHPHPHPHPYPHPQQHQHQQHQYEQQQYYQPQSQSQPHPQPQTEEKVKLEHEFMHHNEEVDTCFGHPAPFINHLLQPEIYYISRSVKIFSEIENENYSVEEVDKKNEEIFELAKEGLIAKYENISVILALNISIAAPLITFKMENWKYDAEGPHLTPTWVLLSGVVSIATAIIGLLWSIKIVNMIQLYVTTSEHIDHLASSFGCRTYFTIPEYLNNLSLLSMVGCVVFRSSDLGWCMYPNGHIGINLSMGFFLLGSVAVLILFMYYQDHTANSFIDNKSRKSKKYIAKKQREAIAEASQYS